MARLEELLGPLAAIGVSHLLVPVFSEPTVRHRWEQSRASAHVDGCGATVVVVNSLTLGRLKRGGPLGYALATAVEGTATLEADHAASVGCFDLKDGEAPRQN
jgi:hypothetical protein